MIKLTTAKTVSVVLTFLIFCLASFVFNVAAVQAKETETIRPAVPENIAALIQAAGDAAADQVRLDLLKKIRKLPDLDPTFTAELDRFIDEVDQWINSKSLLYFYRSVRRKIDWDFGVAADSPLFPLTWLYRGRMLAWTAIESSEIRFNPTRCREVFDKARWNFEQTKLRFPKNLIARMYLGEHIQPHKHYNAVPGAPRWAVYQREGIERTTDIVEWWIDNRQQEDGQYGGRWGDDCEMWGWWSPAMLAFESPKMTAAQELLSRGLMSQPHMKKGYTNLVSDVEHSAEPSSEAILPMMFLKPDDPVWVSKSLRLAELMKKYWTGRNERGFLQFKSTFLGADKVDDDPQKACDTTMHPRTIMPTLLYWQRTHDPNLTGLFTDWMDTWVEATARAERGKPAGIMPSALHWPDGNIGGLGENWWYPDNYSYGRFYTFPSRLNTMLNMLLLTWHITGDEKYLEPMRSMARIRAEYLESPPKGELEPGSKPWCASQLGGLSGVLAKYRFLTGSTEFDDLLQKDAPAYMRFRMTGDREPLIQPLRNITEALRFDFESHTSEPRYTDKIMKFTRFFHANMMYSRPITTLIYPSTALLGQMATGGIGSKGYFPLSAVRWLTSPREIAALVTESGKKSFCAELFHFGDKPREMGAELYQLAPGNYQLIITVGDGVWEKFEPMAPLNFTVKGSRTHVSFTIPPRKLSTIKISPI